MQKRETFIDEKQSQQAVSTTFITLAFVFLGMMITALLYWSYQRTEKLFITIFSFMTFSYSLMMVIFITVIRSKLTLLQFKIFLSASIFMCIISLILFIYFVIKAMDFMKRSSTYTMGVTRPPGVGVGMAPPMLDAYGQPMAPGYGAAPMY